MRPFLILKKMSGERYLKSMPKLSIIIPVYNAKVFLETTLLSLFATTKSEFELILLDDFSYPETRDFVAGLESPSVEIRKVLNVEHKWCNYNWNLGVVLAKGDYIAILNSDIALSDGWDLPLIDALNTCTVACPYEIKSKDGKNYKFTLDPVIKRIDPGMIKGACFMFKASQKQEMFPIPQSLKHWCGDNWIADRANQLQKVKFVEGSFIRHAGSVSSKTVKPFEYKTRILQDLDEYEKLSDRRMKIIKDKI